jgi:hypothetical protein
MKKLFPFYNLRLFDVLSIIIILGIAYQIYEYGFVGYITRRYLIKGRQKIENKII